MRQLTGSVFDGYTTQTIQAIDSKSNFGSSSLYARQKPNRLVVSFLRKTITKIFFWFFDHHFLPVGAILTRLFVGSIDIAIGLMVSSGVQ